MVDDFTDSGAGSGGDSEAGAGGDSEAGAGSDSGAGAGAGASKEMGTGAQVFWAVATVGALVGGMWLLGDLLDGAPATTGPAVCSSSDDASPAARGQVSGAQLCTALNRSDLPKLLGTPTEQAVSASGSETESTWAGGTKTVTPEAKVELDTYTVQLSASYDDLPVTDSAEYLGETAENKTVLGHPAVLYSGRTIAISFNLGGGDTESGPGGVTRQLLIAGDAKDSGSSYELVIWRQDSLAPDDEALFRIAEKVLPTIPGWKAAD